MCLNIVFSLLAFSRNFSKWIFFHSSQDSWSTLISCSGGVSFTFLLLAACQFSRMSCSSIMVFWSSSCLFLCSRYFIIHLDLSRLRDRSLMSTHFSWMISLSFKLCGPKSVLWSWWELNLSPALLKVPHHVMATCPCPEPTLLMDEMRPLQP